MNSRSVHAFIRKCFPEVMYTQRDWINAMDESGLRTSVIRNLMSRYIHSDEMVVWAGRRNGGVFPLNEAIEFIGKHAGQTEIRITDRLKSGFVVLAGNGVAAGWKRDLTNHYNGP